MISILIILLSLLSCNDSNPKQNQQLQASIQRGAIVYEDFCMQCHMPDGKGVEKAFPPLANSDYLMNKRKESIKAIKYGLTGEITVNGKKYKTFYGMSSERAMKKHDGAVAAYRSAEGKTVRVEHRGLVKNTLESILGGLRSACTYIGARRLKDMPKCATFIRVTQQSNEVFGKNG